VNVKSRSSSVPSVTITILDITHRPVFCLKQISESGFCLHLEVEPTQLRPIGPWRCDTSRIPLCLESGLTEGGEIVSLTRRPHSSTQKDFLVLISVRG
jgi:hypothetical protein